MNYEDHLKRHIEKQAEERADLEKKLEEEKTAIRVACEEAEKIIQEVIAPEMEKLEAAIVAVGKTCTLKISRKKVRRIDSNFEIEISIDHHVTDKLAFTGDPEERMFAITLRNSRTTHNEPHSVVAYSKITTEFVSSMCEKFMLMAFPV